MKLSHKHTHTTATAIVCCSHMQPLTVWLLTKARGMLAPFRFLACPLHPQSRPLILRRSHHAGCRLPSLQPCNGFIPTRSVLAPATRLAPSIPPLRTFHITEVACRSLASSRSLLPVLASNRAPIGGLPLCQACAYGYGMLAARRALAAYSSFGRGTPYIPSQRVFSACMLVSLRTRVPTQLINRLMLCFAAARARQAQRLCMLPGPICCG